MAGFEQYANIPGMPVEFKDGGSVLRTNTSTASTKSMLILGTAEDGPVLEPVAVDQTTASAVFGKSSKGNGISNNSTLMKDFEQAWAAGCRDIRLMRITGSVSSHTLNTEASKVINVKKLEESKGIVGGNNATTFTLQHTPEKNTERVYSKGSLVSKGYTLAGKELTINKNATDAGSLITVTYAYYPELTAKEKIILAESTGSVTKTPVAITEVSLEGTRLQLTTDYTVSGKTITIVKEGVEPNAPIDVVYTYLSDKLVSTTENNNGSESYVTDYAKKTITLNSTPVDSSIRIYIGNIEVSNRDAYKILENHSIEIDKKYFAKTDEIIVSYLCEEELSVSNSLLIESSYGGEIYNQCKVIVKSISDEEDGYYEKIIELIKPESKKASSSEASLTFKSSDYPTFLSLVNAINSHRLNTTFKASTNNPEAMTVDLQDTENFLTGGDNGLNCSKQDLYYALAGQRDDEGYITQQGAFQIIENYVTDFIVPGCVYADDYIAGRNKDFAYELALLCAIITNRNKTTLGCIAMTPCYDTSLIGVQKHVAKLLQHPNTYPFRDENGNLVLDENSNPIDLGRYIHVAIGPECLTLNSELGVIAGNPAIQYAAEMTMLPAKSSPLNKLLHGIRSLRFSYQTSQIDKLLENRYTIFNTKYAKNGSQTYRMVDGVTCAFAGSEYGRTTTLRCLQEIVDEFRDAAEPFFGEPPSVENRNALASAISKRKDALITDGTAEDISFQLVITAQDYLLGQATLEVDVIPPKEFRKINMVVGLKNTI